MLTTLILVLPHKNKILEIRPLESLRQETTSTESSRKEGKTPAGLPIAGDQKQWDQ